MGAYKQWVEGLKKSFGTIGKCKKFIKETKVPDKRSELKHDPEGIFCYACGQKHNPFFKCDVPWMK